MTDLVRIPFHGGDVLAVDVDGRPHVVLKPAFEAIGLDADQQIRKLKRQPWAGTGVTPVPTAGGPQQAVTADVRTFLMALATIPVSRVAEHVRPVLVAYQREVADVIEAYWTKGAAINPRAEQPPAQAVSDAELRAQDAIRHLGVIAAMPVSQQVKEQASQLIWAGYAAGNLDLSGVALQVPAVLAARALPASVLLVQQWVGDLCVPYAPGVRSAALYASFAAWSFRSGCDEDALPSVTMWGRSLTRLGFAPFKVTGLRYRPLSAVRGAFATTAVTR